jgi:hypothetical protein
MFTLRSTDVLTEISTKDYLQGYKKAGSYGSQPCQILVPIVWIVWEPQLSRTQRPRQACNRTAVIND